MFLDHYSIRKLTHSSLFINNLWNSAHAWLEVTILFFSLMLFYIILVAWPSPPTYTCHSQAEEVHLNLFIPCFRSWFQKDKRNKPGALRKAIWQKQKATNPLLPKRSIPQEVRDIWWQAWMRDRLSLQVTSELLGSESEDSKATEVWNFRTPEAGDTEKPRTQEQLHAYGVCKDTLRT